MAKRSHTIWTVEHFIGGDPAIDLINTVFTRYMPDGDNDLLNSPQDIANWFHSSGLASEAQADAISHIPGRSFLKAVRRLRDQSFLVFSALAAGQTPPPDALGHLFALAADGLRTRGIRPRATLGAPEIAQLDNPTAIVAFLAAISVEAFMVLPRERLHACPRCGWLFVDTSRGGRRRWCSMQTCGNREKAARHRIRTF